MIENALLRQQLIILKRQVQRPQLTDPERFHLLWGAERIGGKLLKLGIEVSKRSIPKYMPKERKGNSSSRNWATFLKNQAGDTWTCDFTIVNDWLFRQWYIFVVMELKTRRIVLTGVTKYPIDEWTARQLREATCGEKDRSI